ncbi:MAG: hypothetical protein V3T47_01715 [Gammaproteobacteria bacterium]
MITQSACPSHADSVGLHCSIEFYVLDDELHRRAGEIVIEPQSIDEPEYVTFVPATGLSIEGDRFQA